MLEIMQTGHILALHAANPRRCLKFILLTGQFMALG